ncbi:STAS domain-containing protein [Streptomyces sp. NBC_01795]|uniref:STAS domain-containing protein n=1 Tax=Streptomyces sp. NBC_01795 TaxID=2975943 RepID=UPI002DDC4104|nr:STAS domain-containing protein [Streptomyces sp. NBC_01795]WSA93777.1 STAS domain-containing protein [Streptomyces sp. NBC_01795]
MVVNPHFSFPPSPSFPASSDGVRLVGVKGELDIATVPELESALDWVFAPEGRPLVVLDMLAVTFLDCAIIRPLLHARSTALSRGGALSLVCGPTPVRRLLRQLSLERHLVNYGTMAAALAAPPHRPER